MPASCFRNSDAPARRSIFTASSHNRCRLTPTPANNLATALLVEGRAEEARAALEQALAHEPDFPEAFYNLGNACRELGDLSGAISAYRNALQLRPDYADAFSQLGHHRAQACEWSDFEADQAKLVEMVRQGIRVPPFYLLLNAGVRVGSTDLRASNGSDRSSRRLEAVFAHERSAGERAHSARLSLRRFSSTRYRTADGRIIRVP